jgi:16S rRNA (guanine527-N7)-methyltransferase
MELARIAALLEPYLDAELTPSQLEQISTYIDLLLRWNARINLTAIRNPEEIVTRHFGESLFLARHLFPREEKESVERTLALPPTNQDSNAHSAGGSRNLLPLPAVPYVIDLGSGAGFPALPLKIWAPQIRLRLIESNHKKAAFLREAARALTLTNIDVIAERAEAISARRTAETQADVVTFRAVEKFDKILPLSLTFLAPSSRLALLISAAQLPKLESQPSLRWQTKHIPKSQQMILAIGQFSRAVTQYEI